MLIRAFAGLLALLAFLSNGVALEQTPPALRLPDAVRPVRYAAELTVVPGEDGFRGTISIDLDVTKPTATVWLNASFLRVERAWIDGSGRPLEARVLPGGDDFVGLQFEPDLATGAARLHVEYGGEISKKDTAGIFAQREGQDWYAFTQFEPRSARRAFPCFDEPGYKVPWQLSLIVRDEHVAVSNTPIASQTSLPGGMKRVTFVQTRPLPSYLIAFGVGPFDVVDAGTAGAKATPVRIVTPRGMASQARYAARVTPRILALSEQYTGIPYPFEKLDSMAIPQTVSFGAMENPGLITYGMPLILAKPQDESPRFMQTYAQVAAHEIGHMWFGDLVTHAWWDDIWLNESFATWFARKITDRFEPSWGVKVRELDRRSEVMSNDALASARRIRQPIENNSDIANAFDSITYTKGGAVLAMFEAWIGEETFRAAVRRYLGKYSYANATAADFLAELTLENAQAGAAFATFLEQAGVPLISMQLQCDKSGAKLHLSQQRFLPLGSAGAPAQLWQVPVCVSYKAGGKDQRACALLKSGKEELSLGGSCPVSLAAETARYYRVRHDGALLQKVAAPKQPAETVALIGDVNALAHNGTITLSQALKTVQPFAKSANRHVTQSTMAMLGGIRSVVPEALRPAEARLVQDMFGQRARSLGLGPRPDESEDARQLRPSLIRFVIDVGDDRKLGSEAIVLAKRWLQDRSAIDGSMVQTVMESAARQGDRGLFELFRAELGKTQDRRDRRTLLAALGSFNDTALTNEALGLLLDPALDIRESSLIAWTVSEDPHRGRLAYEFMKRNFDTLIERMPRESGAWLPRWGGQLCDEAARADMEAFFRDHIGKFTGGPRNLAQTLEKISLCAAFRSRQQENLAAFLQPWTR